MSAITELAPCVLDFYSSFERDMFAALLCRIVGETNFLCAHKRKPDRYTFLFWATAKEKQALDYAWDRFVQLKWASVEDL